MVEDPTEEDDTLLDLNGFSNVVVIKSKVYLSDASLFQYTESRHRPDKFRFVELPERTLDTAESDDRALFFAFNVAIFCPL